MRHEDKTGLTSQAAAQLRAGRNKVVEIEKDETCLKPSNRGDNAVIEIVRKEISVGCRSKSSAQSGGQTSVRSVGKDLEIEICRLEYIPVLPSTDLLPSSSGYQRVSWQTNKAFILSDKESAGL